MRKLYSTLAATGAFFVAAVIAAPVALTPSAAAAQDFSPYVGATIGYERLSGDLNGRTAEWSANTDNSDDFAAGSRSFKASAKENGFLGGVRGGVRSSISKDFFVEGEAEVLWHSADHTTNNVAIAAGVIPNGNSTPVEVSKGATTARVSIKTSYSLGLTARVGYVIPNAMDVYVLGGPQWYRIEAQGSAVAGTSTPADGRDDVNIANIKGEKTVFGYTLGVGVAREFANNIRGRLEYRYTKFDNTFSTRVNCLNASDAACGTGNLASGTANIKADLDPSSLIIGVDYMF